MGSTHGSLRDVIGQTGRKARFSVRGVPLYLPTQSESYGMRVTGVTRGEGRELDIYKYKFINTP